MIDVLVSTYGSSNPNLIDLKSNLIQQESTIKVIHQKPDKGACKILNELYEGNYFVSYELGLSKSRNIAISKAQNEYCILADDDVRYVENFEDIIIKSFKDYPSADILTFKIIAENNKPFKKYKKGPFWYTKREIFKASSIEVAFRLNKIKSKALKFDEEFGLGAKYALGEEAIFLSDAIDKGLNIRYLPLNIVYHPFASSGKNYSDKNLIARGAQLARIFGWKSLLIDLAFWIKIILEKKNLVSLLYISKLFKGSIEYLKYTN